MSIEESKNKSNNTITTKLNKIGYSVRCMICDEYVPLTDIEEEMIRYGHRHIGNKICDKCKKAVLYIRSMVPEE
jgi:hypothetical protein